MVLALTFATPAQAQFGSILKKAKDAVKEKAKEKVEEAKEKVVNKAANAVDNTVGKDKNKPANETANKAADKTENKTANKAAGNTDESIDTYFFVNGSNLSKSGAYNKLINLYKQNFKPSKEAVANEPFASDESVPSGFSKSYKQMYAAYEHLDPKLFPLQPYYKYPTFYALGKDRLIYPLAYYLDMIKMFLTAPMGYEGYEKLGIVGYNATKNPELVSADGQKLAMQVDELFRYPMAARFFADPNCKNSVWALGMLLAYESTRVTAVKEYAVKGNTGVADAKAGLMFPYAAGVSPYDREVLMRDVACVAVDINLIAATVNDFYEMVETSKEPHLKVLYMLAGNEMYKHILTKHKDYERNKSKFNSQLMAYTRYNNTPEYAEIVNAAVVTPEPPTMVLKAGAMDRQLNAQVLSIAKQKVPGTLRVVVINEAWKVHYNGTVPTDRAVRAWVVYRNKKGKLEAHDYSFCQDYQGGGKYGAMRYKGVGMQTVYVKQ